MNSGQFQKNHVPWNKGESLSDETKGRIRKSVKDYFKEHDGSFKNHAHSVKTKKKISLSKMGSVSPRKGVKLEVFTKEKIRKARLGKTHSDETKQKIRIESFGEKNPFYGKHHSEITKDIIRKAVIKQWDGNFKYSNTGIELKIKSQLDKNNISYIHQYRVDGKFICDFYLPDENLIIEADGDYWHSLPDNIERDRRKNIYLKEHGFNLVRIPGHEINENNFDVLNNINEVML